MRAIAAALLLMGAPAAAQTAGPGGHGDHAAPPKRTPDMRVSPDREAAERAMAEINARMHAAMELAPTGNLDADFVRNMIPHHQAAIDMAELTLRQSNDPRIRTLARGIIASQRREIIAMRAWLREHDFTER